MKSATIFLFALVLITNDIFAQTLPKKPSRDEVGSYNQSNLLKVDIGTTKARVLEVMGGVKKIQTHVNTTFVTKKHGIVINNPYSREFKTDSAGSTTEVLWYYTNTNKADGDITKEQLTPIVLEKNAVVGLGWDFLEQ